MKKLTKLSLHDLSQAELAKREQELIKGGQCACVSVCLCAYAGPQEGPEDDYYGGSSTDANGRANDQKSTSAVSAN